MHSVAQRASLLRGDSSPRKDVGSGHLFVRTDVGCAQTGEDLQGQEPHLDRNEDNSINVEEAKEHGPHWYWYGGGKDGPLSREAVATEPTSLRRRSRSPKGEKATQWCGWHGGRLGT